MEYQISNDKITVTLSDIGAEMQSVKTADQERLWQADPEFWPEHAPILFPYVGRFTDGKYLLNGKEYEMDIHGFGRKLQYDVIFREQDNITFELRDSEQTYGMYPYHFVFRVTYELQDNEISVTYRVTNASDDTMYFGIGGHPGFQVPMDEGLSFTDYYLEFDGVSTPERIGHTETCFLSGIDQRFPLEDGRILRLSHDMFDDDAIVLRHMSDAVTLKSDRGSRKIRVSYPDMPYLGLWHAPKTEAPYICIEPWTSLPSRQDVVEEFRYKSDLIRLASGEQYSNTWSIRID